MTTKPPWDVTDDQGENLLFQLYEVFDMVMGYPSSDDRRAALGLLEEVEKLCKDMIKAQEKQS